MLEFSHNFQILDYMYLQINFIPIPFQISIAGTLTFLYFVNINFLKKCFASHNPNEIKRMVVHIHLMHICKNRFVQDCSVILYCYGV